MMNCIFKHDWFMINIICHWKIVDDCRDEIRTPDKLDAFSAKPISIVIESGFLSVVILEEVLWSISWYICRETIALYILYWLRTVFYSTEMETYN